MDADNVLKKKEPGVWDKLRTHAEKVLEAAKETAVRSGVLRNELVGADTGKDAESEEDAAGDTVAMLHSILDDIECRLVRINNDLTAIE